MRARSRERIERFAIVSIVEKIGEISTHSKLSFRMLSYFLTSVQNNWPYIPCVVDENTALECIRASTGESYISLEVLSHEHGENIFFYTKEEDKKQLWIPVIRRFLTEIAVKPFAKKSIYILNWFDESSHGAMNACLKILEEPPEYAIILLVVKNPENLLETIHSRTITLFHTDTHIHIPLEQKIMLENYFQGHPEDFISLLYSSKFERPEAIILLRTALFYAQGTLIEKIEKSISELFHTNENPRNILDRVFLSEYTK